VRCEGVEVTGRIYLGRRGERRHVSDGQETNTGQDQGREEDGAERAHGGAKSILQIYYVKDRHR
jgi:hypothetical protein